MADLSVSMILRLVDELSAPLRKVRDELNSLRGASADAGKPAGATEWAQQQEAIRQTTAEAEKLKTTVAAATTPPPASAAGWVEQQRQIRQAGTEADAYKAKLSGLGDQIYKLSMTAQGMRDISRIGQEIGGPAREAIERATEFEKAIEDLARGAGMLDQRQAFGASALQIAGQSNIKWEDVVRGRRAYSELGGGEGLTAIRDQESRLARLAYASGADMADLYRIFFHYIELAKATPAQAMEALEINYEQGKRGAYELKNMVQGMPKLLALGTSFGLHGDELTRDLPAFLQVLRKVTGSAGEADTRLRHVMTQLTSPGYMKRIQEELGIDVSAEMETARKSGQNPLFHILDLIADAVKKAGPDAGTVGKEGIEGGDPKKMGEVFRDYYIRSGIDAYVQLRDQLKDYAPTADEAQKTVMADFASHASTAASALERLAIASDRLAVETGTTQLEAKKRQADTWKSVTEWATDLAKAHPGLTNAGMSTWNWGAKAVEGAGGLGWAAVEAAIGWKSLQWLGTKFPVLGTLGNAVTSPFRFAGSAVGGASQGVVEGLKEGVKQGLADAGKLAPAGEVAPGVLEAATQLGRAIPIVAGLATVLSLPKEGPYSRFWDRVHAGGAPGATPAPPGKTPLEVPTTANGAVTAPQTIDNSKHVTAPITVNAPITITVQQFDGVPSMVGSAVSAALKRGVQAGTASLHDGPETAQ